MKKVVIAGVVVVAICATVAWVISTRQTTYCKRCYAEFEPQAVVYCGNMGERLERWIFCEEVDGHVPTRKEEESGSMANWRIKVNGTD